MKEKAYKTLEEITREYMPKYYEKKYKKCIQCGNKLVMGFCWSCKIKNIFRSNQ